MKESDRGGGVPGSSASFPAGTVEAQLEKILASEQFAHAERLSRLLRFVVEETLHGDSGGLKEYNLGISVFDRDASYDPRTDPIVRVEAGRLRSKLAEYYTSNGGQDTIRIDLPKGSYCPVFHEKKAPKRRRGVLAWLRRQDWRTFALAACGIVIVLLLLQGQPARQDAPAEPQPASQSDAGPLWEPFLTSEAATTVVIGSPLFFEVPEKSLFLRLFTLNEPSEIGNDPGYRSLQGQLGRFSQPTYPYAQVGETLAAGALVAFFARHGVAAGVVPAFRTAWETLKESNLIFLGAPRMNRWLQRLDAQMDFEVSGAPFVRNRNPQPGEQELYRTPDHRDAMSYAVIASMPGLSPGREILILTSHGSAGVQGAAEIMTNPDRLHKLCDRLRPFPEGRRRDYQILLRILSDKDEPFRTEYITHHTRPRE